MLVSRHLKTVNCWQCYVDVANTISKLLDVTNQNPSSIVVYDPHAFALAYAW
jgi:hypothetical protein